MGSFRYRLRQNRGHSDTEFGIFGQNTGQSETKFDIFLANMYTIKAFFIEIQLKCTQI